MSDTLTIPLPGQRTRVLVTGAAIGLVAATLFGSQFGPRPVGAADATSNQHTISVAGTGRVTLSPDVADLRLGVTFTRATVKEAREVAAVRMTAVLAALKKLGVADKDIQTAMLGLQPVYDYSTGGNPPRLTGFQMINAVSVVVRDLDKLGDLIDTSLLAGATSLDGVSFRVEDQTKAEAQARDQAMADAKAKATELAKAAGISITGVASIAETSAPVPYPYAYQDSRGGLAAPAADKPTPVALGTLEVVVTVSVSYSTN
jgi:hypothetical protein